MALTAIHVIMAILASWRISELFTQDRLTDKLRKKWPTYLWQCPRCMSIWSGAWVTLILLAGTRWPLLLWLNWPFALGWLYLTQLEKAVVKRTVERGRELRITLKPDGQFQFNSELAQHESIGAMQMVLHQLTRQSQPPGNGGVPQA